MPNKSLSNSSAKILDENIEVGAFEDHSSSDEDESTESVRPNVESVKPKQEEMASDETKRIRFWRIVMVTSILATGVLVSVLTFKLLNQDTVNEGEAAVSTKRKMIAGLCKTSFVHSCPLPTIVLYSLYPLLMVYAMDFAPRWKDSSIQTMP